MGESNNDNHIYTHLKMLWGVKQTHETKFPAYFLLHFRHCNLCLKLCVRYFHLPYHRLTHIRILYYIQITVYLF